IHYLLVLGYSWDAIADLMRLPFRNKVTHKIRRRKVDVRTLQRIHETHSDGIFEHLVEECGDPFVPLGYDAKGRKLIVNESEASTVRMIFERYARLGSLPALVRELEAEGITGKRGKPIDKSYLYRLFNNPIYVGEAVHRGMYPGEHEAIV